MRNKLNIIKTLGLGFVVLLASCSKGPQENVDTGEGTKLVMSPTFGAQSRLAELPNAAEMGVDKGDGLKNVGVYVYYTSDYEAGDLSKPYVRNMEFTVDNTGQLVAANASGNDQFIYIYAPMTIVAFYPYNADMNLAENHFTKPSDEEKYPITRADYSQQFYIPYRAQVNTDPTTAFFTVLTFYPKHTYKLELVVVDKDGTSLPNVGSAKVLPTIDPVTNPDPTVDGKRENWYDIPEQISNDGSGSFVTKLTTYIWTDPYDRNNIPRGTVLMESDKLTLIASQNLYPDEQRVYRYGYNMTTGEIFIPTSSTLINDLSHLTGIDGSGGQYYQVCDIDMGQGGNWNPISLLGGRYDGGGHALNDMTINSTSTEVGLFSKISGNATVANVNLVDPTINVTADGAFVGALAGRLNTPLTDAEKQALIVNLPPGLSEVVKQALIQEILASAGNSESNVVASKVTNPTITVVGQAPVVGGLIGQAGQKTEAGSSRSRIWDSAVVGGKMTVNQGSEDNNSFGLGGGFVGLNQGYIGRSFSSMDDMTFQVPVPGGNPPLKDAGQGFSTMGNDFEGDGGLMESNFSALADGNNGVTQFADGWPSWPTYTGIWPVNIGGWVGSPSNSFWYNNGSSPSTYPTLQWERK